ncbi:hypothetical protein C8R43DRAFT_876099 [Mycena crocata]|nr:hypothetical protein C8R43DRAFT_876099 [Mycena crocata]
MNFTRTSILLSTVIAALNLQSVVAADCQGTECVEYFHQADCSLGDRIGQFLPTCEGNCFQFSSFDSVQVSGNIGKGTDCHIYSDTNCQNQIADSGNVVFSSCVNAGGAQSMKCFFDC